MLSGFFMFRAAMATLSVSSYLWPNPDSAERDVLVQKSWLEPLRGWA
jgi:hypothetical protein